MVLAVPRTNVSNAKAIIITETCKRFVTCFELSASPQISNIISVYFVNTFT